MLDQKPHQDGGEPDEIAFQALVNRHRPMVRRTAWRILRDDAQADDVAQVVFVRFHEAQGPSRTHPAPGGWLHEEQSTCCLAFSKDELVCLNVRPKV